MTPLGYRAGVNLGGWISQYPAYDRRHFDSFIQECDIRRIADWGIDHVRLPVDYPVLEDDERPMQYKEEGLAYIDCCLEWCQASDLNLILDLHHAPGFSFTTLEANTLFGDPAMQERFLALWEALARRYQGVGENLVFELLNEVVLPNSDPWNALARRTAAHIRQVDPRRWMIVGSNRYNSAHWLSSLAVLDDPYILYTFHFYEPFIFTHQRAGWVPSMVEFNQEVSYPGPVNGLEVFLTRKPERKGELERYLGRPLDQDFLRLDLQPAVDFMQHTGKPLYCGEYGAIAHAPLESRLQWHREMIELFREYGLGRAVWSYKEMDFGLVDWTGRLISAELVKIVSQA
jgi:hypothetical protein